MRPLGCVCESEPRQTSQEAESFCKPAACPNCQASVFFVRHNGGSVWFDPPLGSPWPIHGCFDKEADAKEFTRLLRKHRRARKECLCRVRLFWDQPATRETGIALDHLDGELSVWKTKDRPCEPRVESLIFLDEDAKTMVGDQGKFALSGPCQPCKVYQHWFTLWELAEHVLRQHPMWTCPFCQMTVEARFQREHEVAFQCALRAGWSRP